MSFNMVLKVRTMRKLSILHTDAGCNLDEQAIRILAELEGLQSRGHAVALIAQPTTEIIKRAAEREVPVEAFSMDYANGLRAIWQVMQIIQKRKVDILNTHTDRDSWIGSAAALLSKRRPIVLKTNHLGAPVMKGLMSRLLYERISDRVITMGETVKKHFISEHHIQPERVVSIPTGVVLNRFDPNRYDLETIEEELGYANGPRIVMTGVFTDGKESQDSVAAATEIIKAVPAARFYIVGTGLPADVRRLREVIAQYKLQNEVFILGYREDLPLILSAMDLLVHCSYANNEGLPQAVLQALAMEKPVVATKVGAISEAVFDGVTGYLVHPGDVQSLADRVMDLLRDDLKRKAFGQAGRRIVKERYSLEGMLNRIEQLYQTLLVDRYRND
jgi:glycosyltransferase involved in cell wall biosynthesis